ncbi:MAG TPA: carboxylesterase family protein, partial [Phytomonospora sp.]
TGLPVLVWIHGGMFTKGSGASPGYRGASFARDGVVCVTINYRLGAEGFLHLDDGAPNLGLLDQIAALEWVRDEIAAFGGDPSRVTVAGQSAGAVSVTTLMAMPRARGLFHQAIIQSGAAAQTLTPEAAAATAACLAASLRIVPTRDAFAGIPVERLTRAVSALVKEAQTAADPATWDSLPFAPVIDGAVLPAHPLDALSKGASDDVRLLAGWNRDDTRIGLVPTGMIDLVDERVLASVAGAAIDPYRRARPGASSGDLLAALTTDRFVRMPMTRVAEARLAGGATDTWMYRFDHESPSFGGRLGAAHAVEIPYVFDLLDETACHPLVGDRPSRAVGATAHGAWVRFVTDGDPGWPRYDLADRPTALIGERITVAHDPGGAERETWDG